MNERSIEELARDLKDRLRVSDEPPVLLLGAGASVASGVGAMTELFEFADCANFEEFTGYIENRTVRERYRLLSDFLQTRQPARVTPGYRSLAALCAEGYFDLILTTNLDPLLDDALSDAKLWRKDYLLLINGVLRPERLDLLISEGRPRVKVLKLHGDLFHRFMAWTPAEMDKYVRSVADAVRPAMRGRDVLVVGQSLRDDRIREIVLEAGGPETAIWFVTPGTVPDFLTPLTRVRAITGPRATFEDLFQDLAVALDLHLEPAAGLPPRPEQPLVQTPATPDLAVISPATSTESYVVMPGDTLFTIANRYGLEVQSLIEENRALLADPNVIQAGAHLRVPRAPAVTTDDLRAATIAIIGPHGEPSATGFLLNDPRVIVADSYAATASLDAGDELTIATSTGQRYGVQRLTTIDTHPFGPMILTAPPGLAVAGLRWDTRPVSAGDTLRIAVAAGKGVGVSTGTVTDLRVDMQIAPIGPVSDLTAIDAVVAPGSSGAPVVDESLAVRGFIVAGAEDQPPSLMYGCEHWASGVRHAAGT